jgi:hypothetical protein
MILDRSTVTIACACRRCDAQWQEALDVTEWTDTDGFTVTAYAHDGVTMPDPYQHSLSCPTCSGLRVDVAPGKPTEPVPAVGQVSVSAGAWPDSVRTKPWERHRHYPDGPPFPAF